MILLHYHLEDVYVFCLQLLFLFYNSLFSLLVFYLRAIVDRHLQIGSKSSDEEVAVVYVSSMSDVMRLQLCQSLSFG